MQIAEISVLTVLGAVCIYVLLGLSFAFVYEAVGDPGSQPFFASQEGETRSDYVYFSFITMATVGYGDLSLKAASADLPGHGRCGPRGQPRPHAGVPGGEGRRGTGGGRTEGPSLGRHPAA